MDTALVLHSEVARSTHSLSFISKIRSYLARVLYFSNNFKMLTLKTCGAAGTVTGTTHLLTFQWDTEIFQLLIDCGMFQLNDAQITEIALNRTLWLEPKNIHAIILTHAHLDHCGRIPYVVKRGFKGPIYATQPTQYLSQIIMRDSVKQMQNRSYQLEQQSIERVHKGKLPETYFERTDIELYNNLDIEETVSRFQTIEENGEFFPHPKIRVRTFSTSHILGCVAIAITDMTNDKTLYFSADLGFAPKPFLRSPTKILPDTTVAAIMCESTYGDRARQTQNPMKELADTITNTLRNGSKVIIPTFAIQRSQEMVLYLSTLIDTGVIPKTPIYLDSPMALEATEIYAQLNPEFSEILKKPYIHLLQTPEQSKELNYLEGSALILAGSGMLQGGRIWQHLRFHGKDTDNLMILVGYQAENTPGYEIQQGKRDFLIDEHTISLKLQIVELNCFSGHADQTALTKWITDILPQSVYRGEHDMKIILVHGEDNARNTLEENLKKKIKSSRINYHKPLQAEEILLWK